MKPKSHRAGLEKVARDLDDAIRLRSWANVEWVREQVEYLLRKGAKR